MTLFSDVLQDAEEVLACSSCFLDPGLKIEALRRGKIIELICPNCGSTDGAKLSSGGIYDLCQDFFVYGSTIRTSYGGANAIQFNDYHEDIGDVEFPKDLAKDAILIAKLLKIGFFLYGPRLWMVGEIEPLKLLQISQQRDKVIETIVINYPQYILKKDTTFYRLRVDPKNQMNPSEYDSAPNEFLGKGRLDSKELPILYGSFDIEACLHEC